MSNGDSSASSLILTPKSLSGEEYGGDWPNDIGGTCTSDGRRLRLLHLSGEIRRFLLGALGTRAQSRRDAKRGRPRRRTRVRRGGSGGRRRRVGGLILVEELVINGTCTSVNGRFLDRSWIPYLLEVTTPKVLNSSTLCN